MSYPTLNFGLGETIDMLRDSVYQFAQAELAPRAAQIDRDNEFPMDMWRKFGDMGLLGMTYLGVIWLAGGWMPDYRPIGNRPMLSYSIALLVVGVQLFSLGVLAELITASSIRSSDMYSIAQTIRADDAPTPES